MSKPFFSRYLTRQNLRRIYRVGLVAVAIAIALIWQQAQPTNEVLLTNKNAETINRQREPIQPIPTQGSYSRDKYALGERLFNEPRLSKNNQISCASCHKIAVGGADGKRYSPGIDNALTKVNTPTVFNVVYNFRFNWDGEHDNLFDHTDSLMQNPTVMGSQWEDIEQKIANIDEYQRAFEAIYDSRISKENVIDAIITYESALITPNAAFDKYLRGETSALSAAEKAGYDLFKTYGCVSCHQGVNIGGNMFQQFGVIGDYFADRGGIRKADLGRFNVTGQDADRHVFRVPSLRNVAITPPYLHDGSAQTLTEAIEVMVKYQLGRPIPDTDIELMAEFLETLTGEMPTAEILAGETLTNVNAAE
ncbi:MAG: cytochrome-c peroxidase [Phormidesmis sp.]